MKNQKQRKQRFFFIGVIVVLLLGIFTAFQVIALVRELPRPEQLTNLQPVQSTKIYDRTGQILLYDVHGEEKRTIISSEEIPTYAKQATIAIEDQSFYSHSAFDPRAFIRAVVANIKSGSLSQGGSTLTQQLAKNVFLSREKTFKRKIKELILAYWIEQYYSKDQIISLYLNQIPYGSNAYGIESASRMFFGKQTKDITLAESAMLAAVIQRPSYYSPWGTHTQELFTRKDRVLDQMYKLGFIKKEEAITAQKQQLALLSPNLGSIKAPHFVIMVREYLEDTYGREMIENGGLKVITSLDWDLQEVAEKVVKEGAAHNSEAYKGTNAALVAQDPKTGQVLSLVGSADYFNDDIDGQFNVAVQGKRQPGSTFKPFAYMTAFQKGYTPDTIVFDLPTEFSPNNPACPALVDYTNDNDSCFHPRNYDGTFSGPVSLKQALAQSKNIPAVKTLYLAGFDDVLANARKMGINTLTDRSRYGLSLVLGGGEVTLMNLVNAYSVFPQEGIKHNQSFILSVEKPDGQILEEYKDTALRVVDAQYPRMINSILSSVGLRSGLFSASLPLTVFDGYDVAVKTGTTNNYRDAWTLGYTPFITVGVWAGNSNYTAMQQQGGSILAALPMWSGFMREAIKKYSAETFNSPEPVLSSVPMVNGTYFTNNPSNPLTGQDAHSILYYIDRDNPTAYTGISNPGNDPQFQNWELPVLIWGQSNLNPLNQIQAVINNIPH